MGIDKTVKDILWMSFSCAGTVKYFKNSNKIMQCFCLFFNPFLFFTIAVKEWNECYFLRIRNERYEVLRIPTVSLWGVPLIYGIAGYCNRVHSTTWNTKVLKCPRVNDWS